MHHTSKCKRNPKTSTEKKTHLEILEEAVAHRHSALRGLLGGVPALDNRRVDEPRRQARHLMQPTGCEYRYQRERQRRLRAST